MEFKDIICLSCYTHANHITFVSKGNFKLSHCNCGNQLQITDLNDKLIKTRFYINDIEAKIVDCIIDINGLEFELATMHFQEAYDYANKISLRIKSMESFK